jgi:hypothetical protein
MAHRCKVNDAPPHTPPRYSPLIEAWLLGQTQSNHRHCHVNEGDTRQILLTPDRRRRHRAQLLREGSLVRPRLARARDGPPGPELVDGAQKPACWGGSKVAAPQETAPRPSNAAAFSTNATSLRFDRFQERPRLFYNSGRDRSVTEQWSPLSAGDQFVQSWPGDSHRMCDRPQTPGYDQLLELVTTARVEGVAIFQDRLNLLAANRFCHCCVFDNYINEQLRVALGF